MRSARASRPKATGYIEKHGGKVLGSSKHPLGTSDFASLLLQAQNSKAKVIGLANAAATPSTRSSRPANSASRKAARPGRLLLFINDVHGMGLKVAQGLLLTEAFYGT